MAMMKRVVVVGGTGLLGRKVVQALHSHSEFFKITVLSRNLASEPALPGVTYVAVDTYTDLDTSPLVLVLRGHDVLISMLSGPIAPTVDPILLSAAIKAKVPHFMPSEYTLDVTHPTARALGAGNLISARAAFADEFAEIAASEAIKYTTLVVGGFLDIGLKSGLLGFDIAARRATLYDGGMKKSTGSSLAFVANAVVSVLRMPEEATKNRRIHVVEVEYDGREILAALENETGMEWTVNDVSTDEMERRGRKALAEGNRKEAYLNFVVKLNFDGKGAGQLSDKLMFGEGIGLRRRTLAEIVKQVVDDFKKGDVEGTN